MSVETIFGGHTILWVIYHEAWHYVLSLSFSLALLSGVYYLSLVTCWPPKGLVFGHINLTFVFLLSVSLALCWHYILDIKVVAETLRFWWWMK